MIFASDLSNEQLAFALRCCFSQHLGCEQCPVDNHIARCDCADDLAAEAANRLEGIVSITAARDAMERQLKKMGVRLDD